MIWVIGCKGMLGRQLCAELDKGGRTYCASDIEVDITDVDAITRFVEGKEVDWMVNCSAYTAVDKAESDSAKAHAVNALGAGNLAVVAERVASKLVHFSTDYVFDGELDRPYKESDKVNPLSVYGKTKLAGEHLIQDNTSKAFIIRISWLYGRHGGNFVKTMLRLFSEKDELNVVNDQFGSPTYAAALSENIIRLVGSGSDAFGIYHYADDGYISWYDFAVRIKVFAREYGLSIKDVKINPVPSERYPTPARRPRNSRFDKTKVKRELNFEVSGWMDNLGSYFRECDSKT